MELAGILITMAVKQLVHAIGQYPNRQRIQERDDHACARLLQLIGQRFRQREDGSQRLHRDTERQLQR